MSEVRLGTKLAALIGLAGIGVLHGLPARGQTAADRPILNEDQERTHGKFLGGSAIRAGVQSTMTSGRMDALIVSEIRDVLAAEASLREQEIDVRSRRGFVRLDGIVPTAADRDLAGEAAAGVTGVINVVNAIEVAS